MATITPYTITTSVPYTNYTFATITTYSTAIFNICNTFANVTNNTLYYRPLNSLWSLLQHAIIPRFT